MQSITSDIWIEYDVHDFPLSISPSENKNTIHTKCSTQTCCIANHRSCVRNSSLWPPGKPFSPSVGPSRYLGWELLWFWCVSTVKTDKPDLTAFSLFLFIVPKKRKFQRQSPSQTLPKKIFRWISILVAPTSVHTCIKYNHLLHIEYSKTCASAHSHTHIACSFCKNEVDSWTSDKLQLWLQSIVRSRAR